MDPKNETQDTETTPEAVFRSVAKMRMKVWDERQFKLTYNALYAAIIESMENYAEIRRREHTHPY